MSAFIVSNRTMTRVLYALRITHAIENMHLEMHGTGFDELADFLYDMNADAVAQRYSKPKERPQWTPERGRVFSKPDALKALDCFLYQCAEGDVPDRPAYSAIKQAREELAYQILASMPAYQAAPWDSRADADEPTLIEL